MTKHNPAPGRNAAAAATRRAASGIEKSNRGLFRYIYLMMGSVATITAVVVFALFEVQQTEQETMNRISLFHLASASEAEEIRRDGRLLLGLTSDVATPARADVAGVEGATPDTTAQLYAIEEGYRELVALQTRHGGDEYLRTLKRLGDKIDAVRQKLAAGSTGTDLRQAIAMLDIAAEQLARLHGNAAERELSFGMAATTHFRPLYLALSVVVSMAALIAWLTNRLVRGAIRRERDAVQALAASREQVHQMQKLEALGQLVGGVAHDFNNLLTAILGQASQLRKQTGSDSSLRKGLEHIHEAASQAANLTRQLLSFSRMQPVDTKVFAIARLLNDTKGMLQRMIGEDIELSLDCASGLPPVEMDPTQLRQVLLNLAGNARDAMPRGGKLSFACSDVVLERPEDIALELAPGHYVKLDVRDSGVGMSDSTSGRVFEPFFSTKPVGRGTGLGLSTVHGIVKGAGGHISVSSKVGHGTCFTILLPAADAPVDQPAGNGRMQHSPEGSETVLIVEDEALILSMLEEGLGHYGYRVLTANNAQRGLDLCGGEHGEIDIMISDVIMPESNGADFLHEARKLQPRAARILMSGYTDNVLENSGLEIGDVPLIQKPFEIEKLALLIRQQLDSESRT